MKEHIYKEWLKAVDKTAKKLNMTADNVVMSLHHGRTIEKEIGWCYFEDYIYKYLETEKT